jgi:nitrate reductase beta subunit
MAVRYYKRSLELNDLDVVFVSRVMREASLTPQDAEEIYALTALPTIDQRYVLPPLQREEAIESSCNPELCKGSCGLGLNQEASRGL